MDKNRRAVVSRRLLTNSGVLIDNALRTPQQITIGNIKVPTRTGRVFRNLAVVGQYLCRSGTNRQLWLPDSDVEDDLHRFGTRIGQTENTLDLVHAWRIFQVDMHNGKTPAAYSTEATDLYHEALDMLKIIGAYALEPEEIISVTSLPDEAQ
jgi:hypothetical protein